MNKALLVSALASHAAHAIKNCISPKEEPEMTTLSKEDVVRWEAEADKFKTGEFTDTLDIKSFATLARADLVAENERLNELVSTREDDVRGEQNWVRHWHSEAETLRAALAAAESKLLDATCNFVSVMAVVDKNSDAFALAKQGHDELNQPRDDSALREMIAAAIDEFVYLFKRHVGGDGEFWLHELEDYRDSTRALAEKAKGK